jgi:hypothetical protein
VEARVAILSCARVGVLRQDLARRMRRSLDLAMMATACMIALVERNQIADHEAVKGDATPR